MKIIALFRSILATLLFPFTVIAIGPFVILFHYIFGNKKIDDALIGFWCRLCCWLSGVKVVVHGRQNIPDEGCLFLFNHSSFFDIFALAGSLPHLRFGAKAELFKIPIFSQAMRVVGTMPIARNNRDEVYKIYAEAKKRFANKEQFALSPEGGRFHGAKLSSFKAGPFVFAMSAGVPVVPTVIVGAYEALPKGSFLFNKDQLSRTIYIHILEPIRTDIYSEDRRKELQAVVYERMNHVWVTENKN
ncbi:lysophospholipid acyltransferase family protein [Pseudobdellovibrio exovorus]|uniref:Putative lysophosphatidic acid acyltransferase n=1 Tax=Pseudobdellovibrio exovorus JSS TaxID=1184267 RepID=M4VQ80_9BACT|nr:lysophospholipid acyltransferase family protein [Pseudobdellovibrio exovorus]AGH95309.1 putative lysophosphatidic acid acyltransferase [Pseudobdellovibrio exovorus JSS]